jgi:hypothetical protein
LPQAKRARARTAKVLCANFRLTAALATANVSGSQHSVIVSFEVRPKKPACQLDAPLEPEPQARQRAPDQFFAENSKGE